MSLVKEELKKLLKAKSFLLVGLVFIFSCILLSIPYMDLIRKTDGDFKGYQQFVSLYEGKINTDLAETARETYHNYNYILAELENDTNKNITDKFTAFFQSEYFYRYRLANAWSYADGKNSYYYGDSLEGLYEQLEDAESKNKTADYKYKQIKNYITLKEKIGSPDYYYNVIGGELLFSGALSTSNLILIFCFIFLIICAPVFSKEFPCNMNELLLTSKHGWRSIVKAKCFVAIGVSLVVATIYYVFISFIPLLITDNFSCLNKPLQSIGEFAFCPYQLTILQALLLQYLFYIIACFSLSAAGCFISSLIKNVLASVVLSCAYILLPFVATKLTLHPSILMVPFNLLRRYNTFNFFGVPTELFIVSTVFNLLLGIIFIVLSGYSYSLVRINKLHLKNKK